MTRHAQMIVGTASDCDIVLDDPSVAPHHCRFTWATQGSVLVEDLGSPNGTAVTDRDHTISEPVVAPLSAVVYLGDIALPLANIHRQLIPPAQNPKPRSRRRGITPVEPPPAIEFKVPRSRPKAWWNRPLSATQVGALAASQCAAAGVWALLRVTLQGWPNALDDGKAWAVVAWGAAMLLGVGIALANVLWLRTLYRLPSTQGADVVATELMERMLWPGYNAYWLVQVYRVLPTVLLAARKNSLAPQERQGLSWLGTAAAALYLLDALLGPWTGVPRSVHMALPMLAAASFSAYVAWCTRRAFFSR